MSAIALAAFCFVFMFSLIEGMKTDMKRNLFTHYVGEVRVRHAEYSEYEQLQPLHLNIQEYRNIADSILDIEGVQAVSPRVRFGTGLYEEGETYAASGLGFDFSYEKEFQDLQQLLVEGQLPDKGKNETLLASGLAKEMNLDIGDKITLLTKTMHGGTNAISFTITGIVQFPVQSLNNRTFVAPLDRIQYLLRMDDAVTEILVKTGNGVSTEALASEVREAVSEYQEGNLTARSWQEISDVYTWIELADTVYMMLAFMFFLLGSTVIINTTMMVVFERRKEIGTIAAMGMTGGEIVRLFFLEAFFISVLGSLIGVIAGIGLTIPLSRVGLDFGDSMGGIDMQLSPVFYPILNLRSTVFVFFYSTAVASVASFFPSKKASSVNPIEALRTI
jgi:putative ABC transport system permease protein